MMQQGTVIPDLQHGLKLQLNGDHEAAKQIYTSILTSSHSSQELNDTRYLLATLLYQQSDVIGAVSQLQTLLTRDPYYTLAELLWGNIEQDAGNNDAAISHYKKVLQYDNNNDEALRNIAYILNEQGSYDDAIDYYQRCIATNRANVDDLYNLATIYHTRRNLNKALEYYQQVIDLEPGHYNALCNIAQCQQDTGLWSLSEQSYLSVIHNNPDAKAMNNYGSLLHQLGRYDEAISCYQNAIKQESDYADAHLNLALTYLLLGDMRHGWKEYEWRLKLSGRSHLHDGIPVWNGESLANKRILIVAEQGYGDSLQFLRFIPFIKQKGAYTIVEIQPGMASIGENIVGIDEYFERGETNKSLIADYQVSLMSIPACLDFGDETLSGNVPYIHPIADAVSRISSWIDCDSINPKIGLVWGGRPKFNLDPMRCPACTLETFIPLLQCADFDWYSLQKGDADLQINQLPSDVTITDLDPYLDTFSDTAAAISLLDMVITIDTSVAHLAGAMGIATCLLLPSAPDWRWRLESETSDWYPSLRLYRQKQPGDWPEVINRILTDIKHIYQFERGKENPASSHSCSNSIDRINQLTLQADHYYQQQSDQQAKRIYNDILDIQANNINALFHLAVINQSEGNLQQAKDYYQTVLKFNPDLPEVLHNLGLLEFKHGHTKQAIDYYHQALARRSDFSAALCSLGIALLQQGDASAAIQCFQSVLESEPENYQAMSNLGVALKEAGDLQSAEQILRQVCEHQPNSSQAMNNMGNILKAQGKLNEALGYYQQSLSISPENAEVFSNLGNTFQALGQLQAGIAYFKRALEIDPNFAQAHWNLSIACLLAGDYRQGFSEYEWGFNTGQRVCRVPGDIPRWCGENLTGKSIRVLPEQGVGDTLQFIRFLPLLQMRCQHVTFQCQPGLEILLKEIPGIDLLINDCDQSEKDDYWIPLMSLPALLNIQLATIPATIPYITVSPAKLNTWKNKLAETHATKVGFVWAGNPGHENDHNRSCSLDYFLDLQTVAGIQLYSLQMGAARESLPESGKHQGIIDLADDLHDWSDTAGAILNLDLVITVDTSVAHLAGALGQRVWTLLPYAPDWRWLLERDDSPWYTSMLLFRQRRSGDWGELFSRIKKNLLTLGESCTHQAEFDADDSNSVSHLMEKAYEAIVSAQPDQARDIYESIIQSDNTNVIAYNNLANTYQILQRHYDARACYLKAMSINHAYAEPYNGMAGLLLSESKWQASLLNLNKAIELQADHVRAHYNRALLNLLLGHYSVAWDDFEYRLRLPGRTIQTSIAKRWQGEIVPTETIHVIAEQGIGDSIQFIRFLPQVKACCRHVILECQSGLETLLDGIAGVDGIVTPHAEHGSADYWVPLMSLPKIFNTTQATIPIEVPYITKLSSKKIQHWNEKLANTGTYKVGIVWAGNPGHENDRNRSCGLDYFLRLQGLAGIQLYSLQVGAGREQLTRHEHVAGIIDLADELIDWSDTAAVIVNLDLVISVDTSVAHLAGALGQRVWTLLPQVPDWRWLLNRNDTPWYPSMVLFRQQSSDGWADIFHQLSRRLMTISSSSMNENNDSSQVTESKNVAHLLQQGFVAHQSGNLQLAENYYRKILVLEAENKQAMLLLANLSLQQNELQSAAKLTDLLRNIDADNPHVFNLSGLVYMALGNFGGAESFFKKAIKLSPGQFYFHDSLATVYKELGKYHQAVEEYRTCLQLQPGHALSFYNMAVVFEQWGKQAQAMQAYQSAIEQDDQLMQAYNNLGSLYGQQKEYDEAIKYYQSALKCSPDNAEIVNNLGLIYQEQEKLDRARDFYQQALDLNPEYADAYLNLGTIEQIQSNPQAAIDYFRRSIQLKPDNPVAYNNMGVALQRMGLLDEAISTYQHSIQLDPNYIDGQFNLSLANLLNGDYATGFTGYEWRLKRKASAIRKVTGETWSGNDISGKRILIYHEQGYGDTFQFVRFLPQVQAKGGIVVLECQSGLKNILSRCQGIDELVDWSVDDDRELHYHTSAPLMSLPYILGVTLDSLPASVPYIWTDEVQVNQWRRQFDPQLTHVGIVWAGRPTHQNDNNRSCRLTDFMPLDNIEGVKIYSLQKGAAVEQLQHCDTSIIDLDDSINDFSDTAAIIQALDLVITVDTSVAHLAGAMGKPVWVVLPYAPDWRWMQSRTDCTWYPSMRLYRQNISGAWAEVFKRLTEDLIQSVNSLRSL